MHRVPRSDGAKGVRRTVWDEDLGEHNRASLAVYLKNLAADWAAARRPGVADDRIQVCGSCGYNGETVSVIKLFSSLKEADVDEDAVVAGRVVGD